MLKRIQRHLVKSFMNNKGIALAQVLFIVGFMVLISVGIMTVIENSNKARQRQNILLTLQEIKKRIEYLARDPNAWSNTISVATGTYNSSSRFDNIRAKAAVNISGGGTFSSPEKIILFNQLGQPEMNLLGPTDTSGNGFNLNGISCANFVSTDGSGNDDCPISYRLLVGFECPTAASTTCRDPRIRIAGRLIFNPSPNGALYRIKSVIPQSIVTLGVDITKLPASTLLKYEPWVERTISNSNRSFLISSQFNSTSATANCTVNGVGACNQTASMQVHPTTLANSWIKVSPSNLVDINSTNGAVPIQAFKFTEAGFYSCSVQAPGFATGTFTIDLYDQTGNTVLGTGSVYVGKWQQLNAQVDVKFQVTSASLNNQYVVRQKCDAIPSTISPGDLNVGNCSLGVVPSGSYSQRYDVVTVSCFKFDKSQ